MNKINEKNELIDFEPQMLETVTLDCENDFGGFLQIVSETDSEMKNILSPVIEEGLKELVKLMPFPLTIVYDRYYVDSIYRDEYYSFFSKKHFGISRNTKRLIFIKNTHGQKELLSDDEEIHDRIENDLIGMVVIKPTQTLGRTLIDPFKLKLPSCYVRTTKFEMSVYGKIYSLNAFPFSGQDSEVMTCAEVNIWQIREYFGNRYKNYRTILPSEMFESVMDTSDVRLLPSDGLTVEQESHVFMKCGLAPKIYYKRSEYDDGEFMKSYEQYRRAPNFEEILHFYVESGIPVLINLREKGNKEGDNHCITCIGHALKENIGKNYIGERDDFLSRMQTTKKYLIDNDDKTEYNRLNLIGSWVNCSGYVILEDHSSPYQIKSLDDLKFSEKENAIEYEIESFVVPLYKHVFMAAEDAYEIAVDLLDRSYYGVVEGLNRNGLNPPYELVIRLFLTTSKSYKNFRINSAVTENEKVFYSQIALPKFIWVCEYGTSKTYMNHKILGEIVLDATSAKHHIFESVISVRNGDSVTYRGPADPNSYVHLRRKLPMEKEFAMYEENNLKRIC